MLRDNLTLLSILSTVTRQSDHYFLKKYLRQINRYEKARMALFWLETS